MTTASAAPVLLTTDETAALLKLSRQTLAVWRMNGTGPAYTKAGRYVRYRPEDIEAWLNEQAVTNR